MKRLLVAATALLVTVPVMNAQKLQLNAKNIDKIVKSMTLEEKAQLVVGGPGIVKDGKIDGQQPEAVFGAAGMTKAIPRLGIPGTVLTDGPAGVRFNPQRKGDSRTYYCTAFPIGTLVASSWDRQNARSVGEAMGREVLDYGCDVLLAPGMNIHRNPLCGRNFEYFSEDPVLSGNMSCYEILGVQKNGVGTSAKHFAANSQETYRTENNSVVGQRALRELYLKNFELALKIGNPWTVMASYNRLNGPYTQASKTLLHDWLRGEMGYQGLVMTDWTGRRNTADQINADDNLLEWGLDSQVQDIIEGVKDGKITMATLDQSVKRMLQYLVKTPHFRHFQYPGQTDLKAHALVSRKAAEQGIILLKNEGSALPLKASAQVALFGQGSYRGFLAHGWGSGEVHKAYVVNLCQGLENDGFTVNPELKSLYEDADNEVAVSRSYADRRAKESDVAVITFKRNAGEGSDRHNTEGDWKLTSLERNLLKNVSDAFHAQGKKVVVVLNIGGVIETASWRDLADAILLPWQPGLEGGNAIADVVKGTVCPSGKLPMTFPVNYEDIPSSKNFPSDFKNEKFDKQVKNIGYTNYDEGIWVGYRYFNTKGVKVAYPFGYGLSYTTFGYSNAKAEVKGDKVVARVTVTNKGNVAGREVVELYVAAPAASMEKPARELKDFGKTALLQPGQSEVLTFEVPLSQLASFNEKTNSWVLDAGLYKAQFGASVEDIRCAQDFSVKKGSVKKCPTII